MRDYLLDKQNDARAIINQICRDFDISKSDLTGHCRSQSFILPRHLAYYTLYNTGQYDLKRIAKMFGNRHHTSISYGINKIKKLVRAL